MKNDAIIEAIKCLLKEYKMELQHPEIYKRDVGDLRYLLNQSIRQYSIPAKNLHISKAAMDRWNEISSDVITKYHYTKKVTCDKLMQPKEYLLYVGANGKGERQTLHYGKPLVFRQMFHEDHIVPVSSILEELINMANVDKNAIKSILDKMHMCLMLKEEDRKLGRTAGRSLNYKKVVNTLYVKNGIELLY